MTARILKFLERGPFNVRVEREDAAWLVICRDHGWLHGSRDTALVDAEQIARGFGVAVVVNAPTQREAAAAIMRGQP
jgi:hypothetical protein